MPVVAGLPFFMVTDFGFFISLFVLHFTQYPVVITTNTKLDPIKSKKKRARKLKLKQN